MRSFTNKVMAKALLRDFSREEGQGTVEYALVIGVVVVALVGVLLLAAKDWIAKVTAAVDAVI